MHDKLGARRASMDGHHRQAVRLPLQYAKSWPTIKLLQMPCSLVPTCCMCAQMAAAVADKGAVLHLSSLLHSHMPEIRASATFALTCLIQVSSPHGLLPCILPHHCTMPQAAHALHTAVALCHRFEDHRLWLHPHLMTSTEHGMVPAVHTSSSASRGLGRRAGLSQPGCAGA